MIGAAMFGVGVLLLIVFVLVDVKGRKSAAYAGQSDYTSQAPNTYDGQSGPGMSGGQDASQGQFDDLVIPPPGQDNNNNFS